MDPQSESSCGWDQRDRKVPENVQLNITVCIQTNPSLQADTWLFMGCILVRREHSVPLPVMRGGVTVAAWIKGDYCPPSNFLADICVSCPQTLQWKHSRGSAIPWVRHRDFLDHQWQGICHRAVLVLPESRVRSPGWVHHQPHRPGLHALQPGSRVPSLAPTRPLLSYTGDSSHLRVSLFSKPLKNNIPPKKGPNPASIWAKG